MRCNVSELPARTNDEGWETVFTGWLEVSRLGGNDAVFVFSVGGGDAERNISVNIVHAVDMAKSAVPGFSASWAGATGIRRALAIS